MSSEARRWIPAGVMAVAILALIVVLISGRESDGQSGGQTDNAPAPAKQPQKSQSGGSATVATGATAAAAAVTPQSTEKVSGPHDDPVPILMYHVTKAAPAGTPYPELWVTPADFKGQMQWLADNGWTGITMAQLFKYWDEGYKLPEKPVVISFDDGYPSHVKVARPVLARHHWPGVLFLELQNVGNPETGLTSSMVKKLQASGWELGSHTITHPDLTTLSGAALKTEVAGSKRQISKKFGVPIDFFCYPAGRYNDATVAAVKAAGYKGAVTTVEGVATPDAPLELKRIRINGDDGVDGFAAKMRSAG